MLILINIKKSNTNFVKNKNLPKLRTENKKLF